jgi:hypothetical protein
MAWFFPAEKSMQLLEREICLAELAEWLGAAATWHAAQAASVSARIPDSDGDSHVSAV